MRFLGISVLGFLLLALASFAQAGPGDFRPEGFRLTSPDFALGGAIPSQFTCDGRNISPTLEIAGVPAGARSLVLIVDDPDAPSGTFTHWLVWNIPPETKKLPAGAVPGNALQGANDFGDVRYSGPCPPSGTHRYFFKLFALNSTVTLPPGASRKDLDQAIQGRVLAKTAYMGRYAKGGSR